MELEINRETDSGDKMKKKTFDLIVTLLFVALFVCLILPIFAGSAKLMVVLSGSMTPIMLPGDMVVTRTVDPAELKVGDVIAFQQPDGEPGTVFTHRIIKIKTDNELGFETQGDANNAKDNFTVPAENVVGELAFVIPFMGYLPELAKNKFVFLGTIILPVGLLIIDELRNAAKYNNAGRAKKLERIQKKAEKHTYYVIRKPLLGSLVIVCSVVVAAIVLSCAGVENTVLSHENTITNENWLPKVYTIVPNDPEQQFKIQPWYGVIPQGNETQVLAPENTPATISSVPYIVPVFWIVTLARLSPYLPIVGEISGYTIIFTLIFLPIWCKKTVKGNYARKLK